jgi:hypothetical protein
MKQNETAEGDASGIPRCKEGFGNRSLGSGSAVSCRDPFNAFAERLPGLEHEGGTCAQRIFEQRKITMVRLPYPTEPQSIQSVKFTLQISVVGHVGFLYLSNPFTDIYYINLPTPVQETYGLRSSTWYLPITQCQVVGP